MTPNTEVVCIDANGNVQVKEGKTYVVLGTSLKPCGCKGYRVDVGHTIGVVHFLRCTTCGKSHENKSGIHWYDATRFVPIDSISISEAYEVLEKQPFEL